MSRLQFYTIDGNYMKYLSYFDKNVSYNKDAGIHVRPYLGIVLTINDYKYFAPLYSYKSQYSKYKNNPSFFFIYDRKMRPLSIIKFSSMIPIPEDLAVINLLDYINQEKKYRDLISAEYKYVNSNKNEIYKRAKRLYLAVTNDKPNFLKTISCNFKLLEEKASSYGERESNNNAGV